MCFIGIDRLSLLDWYTKRSGVTTMRPSICIHSFLEKKKKNIAQTYDAVLDRLVQSLVVE